jgi:hypothetical protein
MSKPTRPGESIAGVPLASLQGDGDEIALDSLLARIHPGR